MSPLHWVRIHEKISRQSGIAHKDMQRFTHKQYSVLAHVSLLSFLLGVVVFPIKMHDIFAFLGISDNAALCSAFSLVFYLLFLFPIVIFQLHNPLYSLSRPSSPKNIDI